MQSSVFIDAATILFREGLEALLVVGALAAFLRRAGAADRLPALYGGAAAAVVASLGMAWVFLAYFNGSHNDLLEAAVMIVAAGLLLYMSGWLFIRQDPRAWQADLNRMAGRAVGAGTLLSLAAISFLAVFREGAETVLFLYALAAGAGGWSAMLAGGLLVAACGLAVVFVAMQWLALRVPLRPIFLVTSAFLFVIALRLVGQAVQELQEQVIVPVHNEGVPALAYTVGLNPTWEALGLQAIILLGALGWALSRVGRASGTASMSEKARLSPAE